MNTHEYEKIKFMKIRGPFMIIHVEKKNTNAHKYTRIRKNKIYEKIHGSFMIIYVEKKNTNCRELPVNYSKIINDHSFSRYAL